MEAVLDLIAVLLGLAALFGFINHTLLKLPHTIGLVVIALAVSLGVLAADGLAPSLALGDSVRGALGKRARRRQARVERHFPGSPLGRAPTSDP